MRDLVRRIDASTPPDRDRALDGLRALAILGVVLGHWLVTALVADSGAIRAASPLEFQPAFTPLSWVFQTLAVFFLVGGHVGARGYAAARARGVRYPRWLATRLTRLLRPVLVVLGVWTMAGGGMLAAGVGIETVRTLAMLVLSPLWFLLVFGALTVAGPVAGRLHPGVPFLVVVGLDALRFGLGGPDWLGWIGLPVAWMVPYCLGAAWADDRLSSRTAGRWLLAGGAAGTVLLVRFAGYPASMVGVPGAAVSNLDPPTLAAVTFGLGQCGAALLLAEPLRRALARPAAWAAVALLNLSAMTVYVWHQTAMIGVSAFGLLAGLRLPGLHTVPDEPSWILARLAWIPVFAVALAVCWATFRTYEGTGRRDRTADLSPVGTGFGTRPDGTTEEIGHV